LALARCRPEWPRSRGLNPAPKRLARCAAACQEALEIRQHAAARHDHVQTPFVRRCKGEDGFHIDHRHHKALNHRAENSHQPTRRCERIIKRFKSSRQAQRLLSVHDQIANLFHVPYSGAVTADFRRASRDPAVAISCEISATGAIADSQTSEKCLLRLSAKSTMPSEAAMGPSCRRNARLLHEPFPVGIKCTV
jgi:hypothetical protein